MSDIIQFENRHDFRQWLMENSETSGGVWLLFGKKGGPKTLSANDALEEALCFGWIDGMMGSIDPTAYKKYFAKRVGKSRWSEKNKKLAISLMEKGLIEEPGLSAIEAAKRNGIWEAAKKAVISDDDIEKFRLLIQPFEEAYSNLLAMPPSVHKTYTGFYLDAKSEKTRQARLEKIIYRLEKNLKPMDRDV